MIIGCCFSWFILCCKRRKRPYVLGGSTTASTDDIYITPFEKIPELIGHNLRRIIISAKLVWQTGVGVGAYIKRSILSELGNIRKHFFGSKSTVYTYTERLDMRHRSKKSPYSLTG